MIKRVILFFILFSIYGYTNAAQVTSTWLLLEYKFQWNFNDTSSNNRASTYTWVILNSDLKQGINFATFTNWKISTNLGWSTDEYGQYTISMWYKWLSTTRQAIIGWLLNAEWNVCSAYSITFDCTTIFDNKWHNIILKKNWKYNKVYIDWKILLDYQWIVWALNYNMDIWYWAITYKLSPTSTSYATWNFYMNWSILWFRVYKRELTASEVVDLYLEYSYIQSNIDTYWSTPLSSWSQAYWTWTYSVSFYVKTLLSQRQNIYNAYSSSWDGTKTVYAWDYNPQTFFSTVVADGWSLNITLTSDYLCNSPYWSFNCSILKDEKKHNILIRKNLSTFDTYLDWIKVFTKPSTWTLWNIWTTLTTYNSSATAKSQFLWEISNLYIYNYMNDTNVNTYFNVEWYISNSLTSKLKWFTNNILTINFTGIQLGDKKETVDYEYSFDNINYTKISSWSLAEQTTSSWSLGYEYLLDVSNQPNWTWNLYFRTNKLWTTKFISKVTFVKETIYDITINEPDKTDETSKNISASFSSWALSMSLTRWATCNNTLTFEKYSNLTFNSTKDNWVRICYKWTDSSTLKDFYKLSNPIEWIVSNVVYFWSDIFDYYTSWKYSSNIRNNDSTFMMLWLLANWSVSTQYNSTTTTTSTNLSSMVDINWDWLIDLLFIWQANWVNKRSIMVNNWDYTFNTVYKCASTTNSYYWDCAWSIDLWN
jgi:hypothetical protein